MPWPGMTDFSEAVQNPAVCFKGTELQSGEVALNKQGLPLIFSGSFACVYSLSVGNQKFAVRCFTKETKDQQSRYEQLTNYLYGVIAPAFVDFEYLEHGINFRGDWYPVVKMEWVEGDSLSKFVGSNINEPDRLRRIAAQWRGGTTANLRGLRIAHNDLQHGNVMVQKDDNQEEDSPEKFRIRLVDYDGMFLPQFRGEGSPELGHKNYQHPLRTSKDYDDYVDNFPTLVIYTSLLAIAAEPDVWSFFNDDNLIFTGADYADPKSSAIFNRLNNSPDPAVVNLTKCLEECCSLPVKEVPDLETILHDLPPSPAPSTRAPAPSAPGITTRAAGAGPATPSAPASAAGYRQILEAQQRGAVPSTPAAPPPPQAAPPQTGIMCSQCNRPVNPSDRFCHRLRCAGSRAGSRPCFCPGAPSPGAPSSGRSPADPCCAHACSGPGSPAGAAASNQEAARAPGGGGHNCCGTRDCCGTNSSAEKLWGGRPGRSWWSHTPAAHQFCRRGSRGRRGGLARGGPARSNGHARTGPNQHAGSHAHTHAYPHAHAYISAHSNTDSRAYAHTSTNIHADPYRDSGAYAHAHSDPRSNRYSAPVRRTNIFRVPGRI